VDLAVDPGTLVSSLATGPLPAPGEPLPVAPIVLTFAPEDCELQPDEGLVGGPGPRRLLTFATVIRNEGDGDLSIGAPGAPLAPWTTADFHFSPCHGHTHFTADWIAYRVRDLSGAVVGSGHKQGWCIEDALDADGNPLRPGQARYSCGFMGISASRGDLYPEGLPGQWVDITGLAPGDYWLEVEVNPSGDPRFGEPDDRRANNTVAVLVRIPAE
jgi:hypothetical protein